MHLERKEEPVMQKVGRELPRQGNSLCKGPEVSEKLEG